MISLIGKDIAKEGVNFVFYGPAEECFDCRFKSSCVDSLEEGRKYKITEVRDVEQKCPVHEGGKVKVVNVENAKITILTNPKGVFEGSKFVFNNFDCDNEDCDYRYLCFPEGLKSGDRCIFVKDFGKFKECENGYPLAKACVKLQK